ncbi:hypothetical protein [Phormidium tenue]|uniref:Uncharacterized protein n=1 Tax=Phormidium tenue FACHB-1050 TaxID=2692857 RepID=A0ABR8CIM1_9CYAN|nr:hypothetical protein [Phormidium tenue]MBD2319454.1 hypothetical protein [Phormidium tenue FACHB-1050]
MLTNIKNKVDKATAFTKSLTSLVKALTELGIALTELGIALIPTIGLFTGTVHIDEIYPKLREVKEIIDIISNKQQIDDKDKINVQKQLKQSPDFK